MHPRVYWKAMTTLIMSGIAILLTFYFHIVLESSYVFTHFFYIPIILATYWYGSRGMIVPVTLVGFLLVTDLTALGASYLFDDLIRSTILILVGFVVASMRDMTRRTEMELESNREQLKEAQRIAHIGNWDWDIREKRLSWSEEIFHIFGLNPKTYVPSFEGYFEFVPEEDRKKILDAVDLAMNDKIYLDLDHRIVKQDGNVRIVHQRGEVKHGEDGNPVNMMGIIQDVTDRKGTEEELLRANIKLNLMNSITRHDMRNLLTATAGYLDLSKKTLIEEKRESYIDKGLTSLGHLQDLIEEAKDYQDIGTSEPTWNDIESILAKYRMNVVEANRTLNVNVKGVEILADPIIEKVLYNLVDNSLRHAGGARYINFKTEDRKGFTALICEDDGSGVLNEEKERIFEKGVGKNTGFGLFFVKEALGITGISIVEEGTYGEGARFVMMIPSNKVRRKR